MFNRIAKFDQLGQATKKADKLLRSGEFDAMVKLWTDFLENDPNCAQAYFERGRARAIQGIDGPGMLADYKKATELNPKDAGFRFVFHLTLGGALQGAYLDGAPIEVVEQAIDHYDVAIETAPKNAEAYTYRGIAFEQLGEDSLAIEDFDEAILLDYGNALARLFRGSIFLNYEELAAAKVDFEVAMAAREKLDEEYAKLLDARYANLMEYLTA